MLVQESNDDIVDRPSPILMCVTLCPQAIIAGACNYAPSMVESESHRRTLPTAWTCGLSEGIPFSSHMTMPVSMTSITAPPSSLSPPTFTVSDILRLSSAGSGVAD